METHDSRAVHARQFLISTRNQEPAELARDVLVREDADLRRCLAWALEVIDDFADTRMDEQVTQLTSSGGLYIAPSDYGTLCGSCKGALLALAAQDDASR